MTSTSGSATYYVRCRRDSGHNRLSRNSIFWSLYRRLLHDGTFATLLGCQDQPDTNTSHLTCCWSVRSLLGGSSSKPCAGSRGRSLLRLLQQRKGSTAQSTRSPPYPLTGAQQEGSAGNSDKGSR